MDISNIDSLIELLSQLKEVKSISIIDAKKIFFNQLKILNLNADSIKYYKNLFYRLDIFFESYKIKNTSEINNITFENLISDCLKKNLSENYINKLIGAIKYMFRLLSERGYISQPSFSVKKLKTKENRMEIIPNEDLTKIMNYANNNSFKEKLIIYILYYTGIRRKELCNILLDNIFIDDCYFLLETTKNGNFRYCFFPNKVKQTIEDYIRSYHPKKYLLEGITPGTPIAPQTISKIIEKIKVRLQLKSLSAHQFRHTFATNVYKASSDIELTRALLGHCDYIMTKRYIHQTIDNLKSQYDNIMNLDL